MEGLKDIKPLVAVPDNSLWMVLSIMIGLLLVALLLYLWFKKPKRKRRKQRTPKEQALQNLATIDFDKTKEAVYTFSENLHILLPQEQKEAFEKLLKKLEVYKYKKSVPALSETDKAEMKKMIEEVQHV
jgi:flagellar biosynthesis/type III secretory pathway M-ring protein FliF/YscJ